MSSLDDKIKQRRERFGELAYDTIPSNATESDKMKLRQQRFGSTQINSSIKNKPLNNFKGSNVS